MTERSLYKYSMQGKITSGRLWYKPHGIHRKACFELSGKLQSAMIMYEKMTMNISITRHYINLCGIIYNLVQHT